MKKRLLFLSSFLLFSATVFAQQNQWSKTSQKNIRNPRELSIKVSDYQLLSLDTDNLLDQLKNVRERNLAVSEKGTLVKFPNEDGTYDTFEVWDASTMHPDLQARYSDIKSFVGHKVGDKTTKIRFTFDPYFGLNALIRNTKGIYYIDSYSFDNKNYIMYNRKNAHSSSIFNCLFKDDENALKSTAESTGKTVVDGLLRRYRFAVSTTTEYTGYISQQAGVGAGTDSQKKAAVLAAVNLVVARLNDVYENDVAVTLQLIPNTDLLFFISSDTYDALDAGQMIDENQTVTDNIIGSANYDIGHVFFQAQQGNDNGLAYRPAVCSASVKAGGVTGSAVPVGDPFVIDYVAHEVGHQFGANHTQNNACNRNNATAIEPGSASSIMGYAGICSPNVQSNSDAYFHSVSINEMYTRITSSGGNCSVNTATGNNEPVVNAGLDRTIPISTPFALTGTATDPDGDAITYNWEQISIGNATMPPRPTNTTGPMFRSLWASTSPTRYFPKLATIIGGYDPTIITASDPRAWEKLSSVARTLAFSLLVRDNNPAGGQTGRDDIQLTVTAAAGPFTVTSQNTSGVVWNAGQTQTITWNVANTNVSPVSTANVTILVSTDGGVTFPYTLVASTPNNGSYTFTVPNGLGVTSNARIMIKAIDNVFLNVNTTNFSINSTLGVNDAEKSEDDFVIYPNPSKGIFTIEANAKNGISYTVFAMDGKLINPKKEVKNTGGKISEKVNLSDLPTGVYIIQVDKDGQKISKKLIINK
ncbi:Por secretion system C-terminal sorting domain-containing protein [Chryseobacterium taeanense]|uniref:Por secretion system C-terminal sorting domain-containing protein n=1 Tax=Chryseobacterium taeanense TaxID=311334 RepID=A0A1G8IYY8_9FLAO|nr:zinc-dependent metalloprotease family protein [Chryseobacterium taeanense]SDI24033.1 Por secretion system C-terminal sorting domain-containing protein [Chryseobacterium taeanense]